MNKWLKGFLWLVGMILVVLVAALIFVNVFIGKSKPFIEGEVNADFLGEDVQVVRDEKAFNTQ